MTNQNRTITYIDKKGVNRIDFYIELGSICIELSSSHYKSVKKHIGGEEALDLIGFLVAIDKDSGQEAVFLTAIKISDTIYRPFTIENIPSKEAIEFKIAEFNLVGYVEHGDQLKNLLRFLHNYNAVRCLQSRVLDSSYDTDSIYVQRFLSLKEFYQWYAVDHNKKQPIGTIDVDFSDIYLILLESTTAVKRIELEQDLSDVFGFKIMVDDSLDYALSITSEVNDLGDLEYANLDDVYLLLVKFEDVLKKHGLKHDNDIYIDVYKPTI